MKPASLLAFALCAASLCQAGTIDLTGDLNVADMTLQNLGFNPADFFFFTANTAYNFNGIYDVEIIAAAIDPAGATALDGATAQEITFSIDSSGHVDSMSGISTLASTVPEPASAALFAAGLAALIYRRRSRMKYSA